MDTPANYNQCLPAVLRSIDTIVFDLLGTLAIVDCDTPPPWVFLNQLGFRSSPLIQSAWESDAFDGQETPRLCDCPGYEEWQLTNLKRIASDSSMPDNCLNETAQALFDLDHQWTVKQTNGAMEVVAAARQRGLRTAVCSNWDYPLARHLGQAGLDGFDALISSAEVGFRKPHPRIFQLSCSRLRTTPDRALFVGDRWDTDVVGAIHAGMSVVWVNENRDVQRLPRKVSVVPNLRQLANLINEDDA